MGRKSSYIGAWLIWIILTITCNFGVGVSAGMIGLNLCSQISTVFIISIGGFVSFGLFVLVYSFFEGLKISKVMPYLWVLGGLGILFEMGEMSELLRYCIPSNKSPIEVYPIALLSIILVYVIHNLSIKFYYKNKSY